MIGGAQVITLPLPIGAGGQTAGLRAVATAELGKEIFVTGRVLMCSGARRGGRLRPAAADLWLCKGSSLGDVVARGPRDRVVLHGGRSESASVSRTVTAGQRERGLCMSADVDPMTQPAAWPPGRTRPRQLLLGDVPGHPRSHGGPDVRTVLLSEITLDGPTSHTDPRSRKVTQLTQDPSVALLLTVPEHPGHSPTDTRCLRLRARAARRVESRSRTGPASGPCPIPG